MKISCITCAFNEGPLLEKCVQSIQNQTYANFEHIIVDDGASPETRGVLSRITDPRVTVIAQENAGLSAARNRALKAVHGQYVCFLDADDTRPNWAFQSIFNILKNDEPDVLFCKGALRDVRGYDLPFYDSARFELIENLIGDAPLDWTDKQAISVRQMAALLEPQCANKVVKTSFLNNIGRAFPSGYFFEDIFFHAKIVAHAARISFNHTPCFAYYQRYSHRQITTSDGLIRLDIIPVVRLTLDMFAQTEAFKFTGLRAAIFANCFKLLKWCSSEVSSDLKTRFTHLARVMIHNLNPLYFDFSDTAFTAFQEFRDAQKYIQSICPEIQLRRTSRSILTPK